MMVPFDWESVCLCLKWESVGSFRWGFVFRVFIWEFLGRLGPFCIDLIMLSIIKLVRFLTIYIYMIVICLFVVSWYFHFIFSLSELFYPNKQLTYYMTSCPNPSINWVKCGAIIIILYIFVLCVFKTFFLLFINLL